jgi:hypothetical protein
VRKKLESARPEVDPEERVLVEAWLDGQLDTEDRARVEAWLLSDPYWSERLPELTSQHRRLGSILARDLPWESLDETLSLAEPAAAQESAPEPSSFRVGRLSSKLDRIFARRSRANYLFAQAEEHTKAERHKEALRCVGEIFDLRDPISLLGNERMERLMSLAESCEMALENWSAAKEWSRRAWKIRQR